MSRQRKRPGGRKLAGGDPAAGPVRPGSALYRLMELVAGAVATRRDESPAAKPAGAVDGPKSGVRTAHTRKAVRPKNGTASAKEESNV